MKRIVSLAALAILAAGCVMVPKTKIEGRIMGEPYSFVSPKNSETQGLSITAEKSTNGTVKVTVNVQSIKATMDPAVIQTTADGQAKLIDGYSNAFNTGLSAGINAAKGSGLIK